MASVVKPGGSFSIPEFDRIGQNNLLRQTPDGGSTVKGETIKLDPDDSFLKSRPARDASDGNLLEVISDKGKQISAANGASKTIDSDGNVLISLPNGFVISHKISEDPVVFDPTSGQNFAANVKTSGGSGESVYSFKDAEGNKWKTYADTLAFQVDNASGSLTQHVNSDGSILIKTKTLHRDPKTGTMVQDKTKIFIDRDGKTTADADGVENLAVNNVGVSFTASGDLNIGLKIPYKIPGHLTGECIKPDIPEQSPEPTLPPLPPPQQPPQQPYPTFPAPQFPGMPGWGQFPYPQFPWPGFPFPGGPLPAPPGGPNLPPVGDPYAAVMTPSGLIRKAEPDGSLFISLPNGIVLSQRPDGKCEAFDSRFPGLVINVNAEAVDNPGYGKETRYTFKDGAGSSVTMYSKSADFAFTSADGNVMQNISSNGDIMIYAKTYPDGQGGSPRNHKVLVGSNGSVSTFGERGIHISNKNIAIAQDGKLTVYSLPYEIPPDQGLMPNYPPIGYYPPGQIPVPNPEMPNPYPGQKSSDKNTVEPPAEKPVKPGIWQKIKNFFNGESNSAKGTSYSRSDSGSYNPYNYSMNPYPGGYFSPFGGGMSPMSSFLFGVGMGLSSLFMSMMTPFPMGIFFNPFGMYGMFGMYTMW